VAQVVAVLIAGLAEVFDPIRDELAFKDLIGR
jgi:hypothetical protein